MCRVTPERFWSRVEQGAGCWQWTGAELRNGYGKIQYHGKTRATHRVAWELVNGPVPDGMCVLHRCDNRLCCRPDHLFLGTQLDNVRDRDAKGRNSHGEAHGAIMLRVAARGAANGAYTHPECRPRGKRNGKYTKPESRPRGEKNGRAKLTRENVLEIRARYSLGKVTLGQLAAEYGIGTSTVHDVVKGRRWQHVLQEALE